MRGSIFGLVALLATVVSLATSGTAAAGDTTCTGPVFAETIAGNLVVPPGVSCNLSGTHVTGNVTVEPGTPGGLLGMADGAIVDGNLELQPGAQLNAGGLFEEQGVTIGGNLQCNQCRSIQVSFRRPSSATFRSTASRKRW